MLQNFSIKEIYNIFFKFCFELQYKAKSKLAK